MIDPKRFKCEVCGVPWHQHTVECIRHGFQPRVCECGWSGIYAECPIIGAELLCPSCGHPARVKVPDMTGVPL